MACQHAQHEPRIEGTDGEPIIVESVRAFLSVYDADRAVAEGRVEGTSGEYGDQRYADPIGRGRKDGGGACGHDDCEDQCQDDAARVCVHVSTIFLLKGQMQARF